METVTGYVEHIVFRNEENGYTVFNLDTEDGEVTCVGSFHYINEGELARTGGRICYTQCLRLPVESKFSPDKGAGGFDFHRTVSVGSGAIKGIGIALAGRIVRKFKEDTFRIIEEEPERLVEVKGISERKAREISARVEEKKDMGKR